MTISNEKLKEIEIKFPYHEEIVDLITAYRQLEKDNKSDMKQITDLIGYGVYYQEANAELLAALDGAIGIGRSLISQVASHIHVKRTRYYHKQLDTLSEAHAKHKVEDA